MQAFADSYVKANTNRCVFLIYYLAFLSLSEFLDCSGKSVPVIKYVYHQATLIFFNFLCKHFTVDLPFVNFFFN